MLILYKESSQLRIITLAQKVEDITRLKQIAESLVPQGLPYKLIEQSDLPTDRKYRNIWEIDDQLLTDGYGARLYDQD
ncbi:hypothetical protein SKM57_09600 [Acinetobacter faecalis]|uniref:hypothetical protein n=1 Tax=Acinetobacter faecalis TaxID=2665161 RepID=UPI002A913231|nr:hypothetical protein [Acinetobacter faecalis]MDY6468832.1 hypothetical protein [Acinetobacter faecalis]